MKKQAYALLLIPFAACLVVSACARKCGEFIEVGDECSPGFAASTSTTDPVLPPLFGPLLMLAPEQHSTPERRATPYPR
jgi:hypothetical protein